MSEEFISKGVKKHGLTWIFWTALLTYTALLLLLLFIGILMLIFNVLPQAGYYIIQADAYLAYLPSLASIIFLFFIPIPIIAAILGLILIFIIIKFIGGTSSAILYLVINGFALLISYLLGNLQTTTSLPSTGLTAIIYTSVIGLVFGILMLTGVYYSYKWKIIGQPMIYIGFAVLSGIDLFIAMSITSFIELVGYTIVFFFLSKSEVYEFNGPKIIEKIMPLFLIISIAIISLPLIYNSITPAANSLQPSAVTPKTSLNPSKISINDSSCMGFTLSTNKYNSTISGNCNWKGGYVNLTYAGGDSGYASVSIVGQNGKSYFSKSTTEWGACYSGDYTDVIYLPMQNYTISLKSGGGGGECGNAFMNLSS